MAIIRSFNFNWPNLLQFFDYFLARHSWNKGVLEITKKTIVCWSNINLPCDLMHAYNFINLSQDTKVGENN